MSEKIAKKLPKRVTNERAKARRARSWIRGQERKKKRREAQEKRHQANLDRLARGELTVHEQKKADAQRRKAML